MDLWIVMLVVSIAGGLGGVVNALMTDNHSMLPGKPADGDDDILRAGILGNVLISAVAGLISWGSVESIAKTKIVFCAFRECKSPAEDGGISLLSIGSLMTAILVGIAGARWLTSEIDKKVMQKQKEEIKSQTAALEEAKKHPPTPIPMPTPAPTPTPIPTPVPTPTPTPTPVPTPPDDE